MEEVLIQASSLLGSILILTAFIGAQMGKVRTADGSYILLNFLGSGTLALVAIIEQQWGFLLLEGVWSLVSLWSLLQLWRGKKPTAAH